MSDDVDPLTPAAWRIRRVAFARYGPFEGVELRPPAEAALTVVYGPNEAGKSSALAGLSEWLFGFSETRSARARAEQRFAPADLWIEGDLDGADGASLSFARVRGRKGDARTLDNAPLPEGRVDAALNGLDRALFEQLFGLDKDRLRAHAVELVESGGALGESLLSAASGVRGVGPAAARLLASADKLYTQRRSSKPVWSALDAAVAARRAVREAEASPAQLAAADTALAEATSRRADAERALAAHRAAGAADRALRRVRRHAALLDGAPRDPASENSLRAAARALRDADRAHADALARRAEAAERAQGLPARDAILDVADELVDVEDALQKWLAAPCPDADAADAALARIADVLGRPPAEIADAAPDAAALADADAALREARALDAERRAAAQALSRLGAAAERAPSTAALAEARSARDAAWTRIRAALDAGAAPDAATLRAYEAHVAAADDVADARCAAAAGGELAARDRRDAAEAAATAFRRETGALAAAIGVDDGFADPDAAAERLAAWRAAPAALDARAAAAKATAERAEAGRAIRARLDAVAARIGSEPAHTLAEIKEWRARLDAARAVEAQRAEIARLDEAAGARLDAAEKALHTASAAAETALRAAGAAPAGAPETIRPEALDAEADAVAADAEARAELARAAEEVDLTPEALSAAVTAADWDAVDARLAEAETEARRLEDALADAAEAAAEARAERDRLLDPAALDAAATEQRRAETELAERVREWLTLRAAAAHLKAAARLAADADSDPLLDDASRLLEALTLGAYRAVVVRVDDDGQRRLAFERGGAAAGSTTAIDAMSEGARDQLCLALRFAAIRRWAASRPAAPFIGDDLLASFDDRRRDAALRAAAELGATTQTLLFTHHRHVVDAAERTLGARCAVLTLQDPVGAQPQSMPTTSTSGLIGVE